MSLNLKCVLRGILIYSSIFPGCNFLETQENKLNVRKTMIVLIYPLSIFAYRNKFDRSKFFTKYVFFKKYQSFMTESHQNAIKISFIF